MVTRALSPSKEAGNSNSLPACSKHRAVKQNHIHLSVPFVYGDPACLQKNWQKSKKNLIHESLHIVQRLGIPEVKFSEEEEKSQKSVQKPVCSSVLILALENTICWKVRHQSQDFPKCLLISGASSLGRSLKVENTTVEDRHSTPFRQPLSKWLALCSTPLELHV